MLGLLLRYVPFLLTVTCELLLTLPATVAAHGGASPSLVVTVDHVDPGTEVAIIAADFGSDSRVVFEMVSPARSTELGNAMAGADGHFRARLPVPAHYPHRRAQPVG